MIGDHAIEARADIVNARYIDQELRKLPNARGGAAGQLQHPFIAGKDVRIVVRNHGRARSGRDNDVFGIAECIEKVPGDCARFFGKAAIERGLAAAGLRVRKINLEAQPLQHLSHGDSDLWEHLIDDAGDEQRDALFHGVRSSLGMKSNCGAFRMRPPLDVPLFFAHNRNMALTKRQKEVLDFIADFVEQNGYSPSYEELAHGLKLASLATVHKHIQALESRNYLRRLFNQSRSLEVSSKYVQERRKSRQAIQSTEVPLAGRIAAGSPVEAIEGQETLQFADFAGKGDTFALQVSGESMIEDHIMSGDYVLVERTQQANDGEIVVALVGGRETTLKRLHHEPGGRIRLQPANSAMQPIIVDASEVQIQGRVLAVLRKYR